MGSYYVRFDLGHETIRFLCYVLAPLALGSHVAAVGNDQGSIFPGFQRNFVG